MNMCQKTFVLPPSSQIVQLCMSKECVEPQPVEPFDHRGVQPGDVSAKWKQGRATSSCHWLSRGEGSSHIHNSNYCDVARRWNEEERGGELANSQTSTNKHFPRKTPSDGLMSERQSTPHVFSLFRLCSNRIIEHESQVCSLLLLLRSLQISHHWKSSTAGCCSKRLKNIESSKQIKISFSWVLSTKSGPRCLFSLYSAPSATKPKIHLLYHRVI